MIKTESNCNGCDTCRNCGRGTYEIHVCDKCKSEHDIYWIDNMELCGDCLENYVIAEYKSDIFSELFEEISEFLGIEEVSEE